MTPSELQRTANMANSLLETTDFVRLPESLQGPVAHDVGAIPAILTRASERIGKVRANVLLSDAGKEDQIAHIVAEEESHLDRLQATLETDTGAYTAMKAKAEAGRFVADGAGFIERPEKAPTGDALVMQREIRDRLYAMPQAERNQVYYAAVLSGDTQLTDAVEHAPTAFPVVTNHDLIRQIRLEMSPAAPAVAHMRRALELREMVIGHGRRRWDEDKDKGRVLSSR